MASPNPGSTNPPPPPLRLPRLSYRTKSCDTESVSSASTGFTRSTVSTTPTSPLHSDFCPSPRSPPAEMSLPSSPRQSSCAPSLKAPCNLTKKRSKFLSGLFGVKEPSAQALQDYERQLMKNGRGRVTAVGMPGVSSAKLPATVPKVNSKWDGVPRPLKEKEKHNDAVRQSFSGLSRQPGSSGAGGSEQRATSTADSSRRRLSRGTLGGVSMRSASSNTLAELYGWETSSSHNGSSTINFSAQHRPSTSRTTVPLQQSSSATSNDPPPRPAITVPPTELSSPNPLGSPSLPSLTNSPMLSPYDPSPATPDTPPPLVGLASPKAKASPDENTQVTVLEVPEVGKEVIVTSAGANILGPPAAAKRKPKPKLTPLQPSEKCPETSGVEFQPSSILRREATVPKDTPSPRPPLASYFPNIVSTSTLESSPKVPTRHNSTRGKLGRGTNSKDQIAAPWPSSEQSRDVNVEGETLITPTPDGRMSLRKKSRMALFRK